MTGNIFSATRVRLSAQFATKEIRLEAALGNVKLPAYLLKRIQISEMGSSPGARSGLVGHWSAEDDGQDSAGENNATLTDVSFADGKVGKAFVFNGETS